MYCSLASWPCSCSAVDVLKAHALHVHLPLSRRTPSSSSVLFYPSVVGNSLLPHFPQLSVRCAADSISMDAKQRNTVIAKAIIEHMQRLPRLQAFFHYTNTVEHTLARKVKRVHRTFDTAGSGIYGFTHLHTLYTSQLRAHRLPALVIEPGRRTAHTPHYSHRRCLVVFTWSSLCSDDTTPGSR